MVICCKFEKNLFNFLTLYTSFHDLINAYSCRSGADNPRGQNFDVNRNHLSLRSFATSFKKISLKSDFIQFFHDFIRVYSPGAGADNPLEMKFWCQQEHLVTSVICYKFQKTSLKSDSIHFFFRILYMYIAPGQGQTAPRGQRFDFNRKALSFYPFVASFKEISLKPDFIQLFSWFNTYTCI